MDLGGVNIYIYIYIYLHIYIYMFACGSTRKWRLFETFWADWQQIAEL